MKHFVHLGNIDIAPIRLELERHPELWDQITDRKTRPNSPHADMSDIWVRSRPQCELTSPISYNEPFHSSFYPSINDLPSVRQVVFSLMGRFNGTELGSILITKVPAGKMVKPHADTGWHAHHHNLKIYIPIQSNAKCINTCGDEVVVMNTGEIWSFNNLITHSTENYGDDDRITLIVSIRCE